MAKKATSLKAAAKGTPVVAGVLLNAPTSTLATETRPFVVEFFPSSEQIAAEEIARHRELQIQFRNAKSALSTVRAKWWKQEEVTGLAVCYRTQMNEVVSPLQYVIQVDVRSKMGEDVLKKRRIACFPRTVCGTAKSAWPVSVKVCERRYVTAIERGVALAGAGSGAVRSNIIRGGIQIASTATPSVSGTLGVCLPHKSDSTGAIQVVGISNQHVVGKSGEVFNLSGTPARRFASVTRSSRDQAMLEKVLPGHTQQFFESLPTPDGDPGTDLKFMTNESYSDGDSSVELWKLGAKTIYTKGRIYQNSAPIKVDDLGIFSDVIRFRGISTTVVIRGGDSGSVLVAKIESGGQILDVVIGLIFAEEVATSIGAAIPFGRVIDALRLNIPSSRLHRI